MSDRVGVLGLARSGRAAALLALARGARVFASDAGDSSAVRDAAETIRARGGEAEWGGHTVERLAECDLLVVSPGIPPDAPVLRDGRLAGLPRISELEFAYRHLDAELIAVTGTNGKTTTAALTAHLLRSQGRDAIAAGNIGRALSDVVLDSVPDWIVVEASSFQLAGIERFAVRVGTVTNLSPDHLDRYQSVRDYYADKARLFDNAAPESQWVLNAEDPEVVALPGEAPGRRWYFRTASPPAAGEWGGWVDPAGRLVIRDRSDHPLLPASELRLLGAHNRENALAAATSVYAATGELDGLADGLRTFAPMRHRLEPVAELDGVVWINDSKATNLASTRVALASVERPTVLLLGGRHKGERYTGLLEALERTRVVVAYGEAAERIVGDLSGHVRVERVEGGFDDVVERARALARPGDAVLLSPACSSYDMFADYEERGRRFEELARARREVANGA